MMQKRVEKTSLSTMMHKIIFTIITMFLVLNVEAKEMSIYDFEVVTIDGEKVSMSQYKGKVLLIVNVASECGFTSQYEGLEKLYQAHKEEGFMVLGFPCNQFREQESKSNKEIKFFCQGTYDVHFDMFAKVDVNEESASPLYKFLKQKQGGMLWMDSIKWNFTKFLVDREGHVVDRYAYVTTPQSIESDIIKLLK